MDSQSEAMETTSSEEQGTASLAPEDAWARIAAQVRADSAEHTRLTAVDSLSALLPELDPETIQPTLAGLLVAEDYADVRPITTAAGMAFLYSELGMTGKYAEILARIEQNDPCATIAETVRNDSKTYPQPTNVSVFQKPPYRMAREELEVAIARTLETYDDIQRIQASTGAVYLYSNRHMKAELARSHVQWLEVEQYANP